MKNSTLIALAVFGVLGVLFFATREPQVAVGIKKLTVAPVKADALVSLEVGAVRLAKEQDAWTVTKDGKTYAADPAAITSLTQALADFKAPDFVTEKTEKHAELEVDAAKGLAIKASTATGVVRELVLGKSSKSGGAYVRDAKSNDVFVTTGPLAWSARKELKDWRNKRIELGTRDDLEKLTLGSASPTVLLVTASDVKLEGTVEPGYRFDAAAAQRLVGQLTSLSTQDFTDEPLTSPAFTLTLGLKGGASKTLSLGAKRADGTVPARVEGDPQGYLLSGWTADALMKDREGLRDLALLSVTPAEVEKATLTANGQRVVLSNEGFDWKLVEPRTLPAGFEFDGTSVSRVLTQLGSTRALRIAKDVTDAKAGLVKPVAVLELSLKGGAKARIALGSKDGTDVYARGQDPFVVVAPGSLQGTLERGLELFKKQPPPPPVQGLEQLPPELRAQLEAQLRQQRGN